MLNLCSPVVRLGVLAAVLARSFCHGYDVPQAQSANSNITIRAGYWLLSSDTPRQFILQCPYGVEACLGPLNEWMWPWLHMHAFSTRGSLSMSYCLYV